MKELVATTSDVWERIHPADDGALVVHSPLGRARRGGGLFATGGPPRPAGDERILEVLPC